MWIDHWAEGPAHQRSRDKEAKRPIILFSVSNIGGIIVMKLL
jgi:hypothetical protein